MELIDTLAKEVPVENRPTGDSARELNNAV